MEMLETSYGMAKDELERAYFGMKTLKSKKWRWDTELKMSISSSMLLDVYEVYPRYKKERNNKRIIVGQQRFGKLERWVDYILGRIRDYEK
jgi:hypothetical protein